MSTILLEQEWCFVVVVLRHCRRCFLLLSWWWFLLLLLLLLSRNNSLNHAFLVQEVQQHYYPFTTYYHMTYKRTTTKISSTSNNDRNASEMRIVRGKNKATTCTSSRITSTSATERRRRRTTKSLFLISRTNKIRNSSSRTVSPMFMQTQQQEEMIMNQHNVVLEKDDESASTTTTTASVSETCTSNDFSYASTFQALRAYHSIHGNLALPRRYVVPYPTVEKEKNNDEHRSQEEEKNYSYEYPSEWYGVDLSSHVYNMQWWNSNIRSHPNRVQELNSLGFIWERLQPEWNVLVEALVTYKNIYGNLLVPSKFVVPHPNHNMISSNNNKSKTTTTTTKTTTTKATTCRDRIKRGNIDHEEEEEDNNKEYGDNDDDDDDTIISTTTTDNDTELSLWPRATWGIPLGRMVRTIRGRQDFIRSNPYRIAQLNAMEFIWDLSEYNFNKCYYAMRLYKEKIILRNNDTSSFPSNQQRDTRINTTNNHIPLRIPNTFVIPSGMEHGWPKELWGYPLGAKCCAIRQKGLYIKNDPMKQRALDNLGFQWSGNASLGWLEVVHAAAIYSQMNGRTLEVPQSFVVPKPPHYYDNHGKMVQQGSNDAWPWPEKLWGLKLGQRLKDIRLKGRYLKGKSAQKRRAQLTTLGFVWDTKPRGRPRNTNDQNKKKDG